MGIASTDERNRDTIAESLAHAPSRLLAPYVSQMVGYHYAGFSAGVHMGLPSRHITFVVSFDQPLLLTRLPDGREGFERYDVCIGGLHTSPVEIHHDGKQHGMQFDVTPAGSRALFGAPAAELAATTVGLDALWGPLAGELHERLSMALSWPERFAVAEHVLCRAVAEHAERPTVTDDLRQAWGLLVGSGGRIEVGALAAEVGWSRRHLTDRFTREFGVGPKSMARVLRFERSRAMLLGGRHRIVDVAATCGYADQAHLTREWQALAGSSPTAWMAAEVLPIVQDTDAEQGARSTA